MLGSTPDSCTGYHSSRHFRAFLTKRCRLTRHENRRCPFSCNHLSRAMSFMTCPNRLRVLAIFSPLYSLTGWIPSPKQSLRESVVQLLVSFSDVWKCSSCETYCAPPFSQPANMIKQNQTCMFNLQNGTPWECSFWVTKLHVFCTPLYNCIILHPGHSLKNVFSSQTLHVGKTEPCLFFSERNVTWLH